MMTSIAPTTFRQRYSLRRVENRSPVALGCRTKNTVAVSMNTSPANRRRSTLHDRQQVSRETGGYPLTAPRPFHRRAGQSGPASPPAGPQGHTVIGQTMYCWVRRPICTDALRPRRSDEPFRHVWAALFSMSSIGLAVRAGRSRRVLQHLIPKVARPQIAASAINYSV